MLRGAGGADRAELLPPGAGGDGVDVFARADPGCPFVLREERAGKRCCSPASFA